MFSNIIKFNYQWKSKYEAYIEFFKHSNTVVVEVLFQYYQVNKYHYNLM